MQGERYCRAECLELALVEVFRRARPVSSHAATASHRVPLGLLLLSRGKITAEQLRAALAAQREAGEGKIGAWLQELGFVTESEVIAALARQWSCPVLRAGLGEIRASHFPLIPALLLESFQMMPVDLVEATGTLLMAFSERIDYTALYAIEQMLGYHTEFCLVSPGALQQSLEDLARRRASKDVILDRAEDAAECAHIIGSYATKLHAEEIRMARCGRYLWVRLQGLNNDGVNLVLTSPDHNPGSSSLASALIASAR